MERRADKTEIRRTTVLTIGATSIALFLPLILAAAFLNMGQGGCGGGGGGGASPLPTSISLTDRAFFENTAVAMPPSAACDLGSIVVNIGQPRNDAGLYKKFLLTATGELDVDSLTQRHPFPAPPDGKNGTDNQIVRMKDGSILAERDHAFWSEVDPPTPWSSLLLFGGNGVHEGYRGGLAFYRSTDCGESWNLRSTVDLAEFLGGKYGWPREDDLNDDGVPRGAGADRTEVYACPFTGNVYATTRVVSGPFDGGTVQVPKRDDLLLLVSKDGAQTWDVVADDLPSWSPVVMTSTPNGRLFLFHLLANTPVVRYTNKLKDATDEVMLGGGHEVYYVGNNGEPVPSELGTDVDYFVRLNWPSVSRVSTDTTTSKIRASYPILDETGSVRVAVIRIEVNETSITPFVANVARVGSRDPVAFSNQYFSFIDPDYVDMPAGTQANAALGYWVEARRCRPGESTPCEGEGTPAYSMSMMHFEGDCRTSAATPLTISPDGSRRGWANLVSIGDYVSGGFWWDGVLNYLPQWVEPGAVVGAAVESPFGLSSGERHLLLHGASPSLFGQRSAELATLGWAVSDLITVLAPDGSVEVDAVWQPRATIGPTTWVRGYLRADFLARANELHSQGWGLRDLSTSLRADGTVRVDAIWEADSASSTEWIRGYTTADFESREASLRAQGWGMHRLLSSLRSDGSVRVDAVWRANTASNTTWVRGYLPADFQAVVDNLTPLGWRIASVATSQRADGSVRVDAVWHKNIQSTWVRGYAVDDFQKIESDRRCSGWTLDQMTSSYRSDNTERIDAVWRKY